MSDRFTPQDVGSETEAIDRIADEVHTQVGVATTNAAASPQTMTAAQMLAGVYIQGVAGAFALTLPDAADVVAAMPNVQVGSKFELMLINTGSGTLTLTAGTGNTLGGHATATLATATSQILVGVVTNIDDGDEAITYYPVLKTAS